MKLLGFIVGILTSLSISTFATTRYVWQDSPSPTSPYTNWITAATNIQDAIDAADLFDLVLVTNGVYQSGGLYLFDVTTNRVTITNSVTLQSVNGPAVTIIRGYQQPGSNNSRKAVRCVYALNGAVVSGFAKVS